MRGLLGIKIGLLALATVTLAPKRAVQNKNHEWVINAQYRLAVSVDPGEGKRHQTPVSVDVDFLKVFSTQGFKGRLNRNSIRVVRYDPATGRALPYQLRSLSYEVPYQLSRDFYYQDSGKIWWRIQDEADTHFYIYFDSLDNGPKEEPPTIALVGCGDNFHFNNGEPGVLDVAMHPSVRYIDWDGDGKKDLLVGSGQTHEYGMKSQGYLYFFKNIGTPQRPLFAPGFQLRDRSGNYVGNDGFIHMYFDLVDWDGDGDLDIVTAHEETFYLYENTGQRDREGLPILVKHEKPILNLVHGNDFTDDYYCRYPRFVDWDGDGDLDIVHSVCREHISGVSAAEVVVPWDEEMQFFEVYENTGRDAKGQPVFAPPKVVRTEEGALISTLGYQGFDYADWDGDGKWDLIVGDTNNYPMGFPRVLWFKNTGTRSKPGFLREQTLVPRVEEFSTDPGPGVVDWNSDGNHDLLLAGLEGWIKICENLSSDHNGLPHLGPCRFVQQTHPLITAGHHCKTAVADWNGDGLPDLIQGNENGKVKWYQNVGTKVDAVFQPPVTLRAGGKEIRMINGLDSPQGPTERNAGYTTPVVVDLDSDGDLDLIVSDMRGYQTYFENIGSRTHPELAPGRLITVDGRKRAFGWRNELAVGDIDGDGQIEIVSTAYMDRHVYCFKPNPKQDDPTELKMINVGGLRLESGEIILPEQGIKNNNGDYMLKLVDWDNDGDLDLFIGSLYNIWYYENVGTKTAPKFRNHGKVQVDGKPLHVSNHPGSVEVMDWNGDGKKDIIIGGESGWTYYFERSFLEGNLPKATLGKLEIRP